MDEQPPLTPLTHKTPAQAPGNLPFRQVAGRLLVAALIWLVVNLVVFAGASFLIFMLLGSLGVAEGEALFYLSILCAIPLALTASGYIAGRRIYTIVANRYQ